MKAAVTDGKGKLWLDDVPVPEPGDYECLCKIEACATCTGTDQKHIRGKLPFPNDYPGILGHESVGTVVRAGPKVRHLKPGDRVLRPCAVFPGATLGPYFSVWGGFADYGLVADRQAMLEDAPSAEPNNYTRFQQTLPADLGIDAADATMLITLKEAASFVANVGAGLYRSVAVLGSGPVGLAMCRFAKIFGASPVIVVARRDAQLEQASRAGADFTLNSAAEDPADGIRARTGGRGVDRLIDTTGDAQFLGACLTALAAEGKAAPYATYASADALARAVSEDRRITAGPSEDLAHAYLVSAVRMGLVTLSDFYSHRMPLARIVEGFEMLRRKEASKIVFETE